MHELTSVQWGVFTLLGLLIGLFTAGSSYLINELMFRIRMNRSQRELTEGYAPVDIVDRPKQRECPCLVQRNANGELVINERCEEHREGDGTDGS